MPDEIDSKLLDKRVATRYVKKGVLDEKEYERHLKSLPDLAEQAVAIEAALNGDEYDDDEDEDDEPEAAPEGATGGNTGA